MPRFRPRDLRQATLEELRRQLNEIQKEISSDIDLLARRGRTTELQLGDYAAAFGDLVRMAAPATGARLILPEPLPGRVGDRVTLASEAAVGAVTVEVVDGTINGQDTLAYPAAVYTAEFVLTPDGWFSAAGAVASSAVLDAEFVVGAAHATLPNGRVATDSTEVDAVLTTPNVITWALNLASIAFSKLVDLAGLSILGRSANSTGVMAAITASAARQVPRVVDAGTSIAWGFPIEAQEAGVDLGDAHTVNAGGRLSGALASNVFTISAESNQHAVSFGTPGTIAVTLPSSFVSGDTVNITLSASGDYTLTQILANGGGAPSDLTEVHLALVNIPDSTTVGATRLILSDLGAGSEPTGGLRVPGTLNGNPAATYLMASEEESVSLQFVDGSPAVWRFRSGTAAQPHTGDVVVAGGMGGSRVATLQQIVGTAHLLAVTSSRGVVFNIQVAAVASGATGTLVDVTVFNADAPFAFRIFYAMLLVSVAQVGTTAALRTATGGGGSVVLPDATAGTQTFTTATTGTKFSNAVNSASVSASGTLILRIDRAVTASLLLFCART